eukprot:11650724-Karenia_brevis.AAC.1
MCEVLEKQGPGTLQKLASAMRDDTVSTAFSGIGAPEVSLRMIHRELCKRLRKHFRGPKILSQVNITCTCPCLHDVGVLFCPVHHFWPIWPCRTALVGMPHMQYMTFKTYLCKGYAFYGSLSPWLSGTPRARKSSKF